MRRNHNDWILSARGARGARPAAGGELRGTWHTGPDASMTTVETAALPAVPWNRFDRPGA